MPKGKILMGKKTPANKAMPARSNKGGALRGQARAAAVGARTKSKAKTVFPRGLEIAGSPIRPGLDKMSITGTTTNTIQRGGGVKVVSEPRGTWRYAAPEDVIGTMNANRAYGKGLLNEDAAFKRAYANKKAGQKRRGI